MFEVVGGFLTASNSITPSTVRIRALRLFNQGNRVRNLSGFQRHRIPPPPPTHWIGFVLCKSPGVINIYGIAADNEDSWNKEIEVRLKGFARTILDEDSKNETHFLIFGPWHSVDQLPPISSNIIRSQWVGTSEVINIAWMAEIQPPNNMLLFRIANLNTSISNANWNTNYIVPPSVGFTILFELLLDIHGKSVGLMVNWTDEVIMAKLAKVRAGDKRKKALGTVDDYASAAGPKCNRRLNDELNLSFKIDSSQIRILFVDNCTLHQDERAEPQIKIEKDHLEEFEFGAGSELENQSTHTIPETMDAAGEESGVTTSEVAAEFGNVGSSSNLSPKDRRIEDLPHTGNIFSWSGTRRGRKVYEKLDRPMGNVAWFDTFTTSSCRDLPVQRSDHGPLLISTKNTPKFSPRTEKPVSLNY
ncbi:hypothetical protein LIER_39002 [Lithospermum erythrorhizon]|uniref:Endonuclease/exonuclease/phosphatase n=1 Tax=Lithospermum erythrorhizon TaxID=34254 RepID=A0AAV3QAK2_LITER